MKSYIDKVLSLKVEDTMSSKEVVEIYRSLLNPILSNSEKKYYDFDIQLLSSLINNPILENENILQFELYLESDLEIRVELYEKLQVSLSNPRLKIRYLNYLLTYSSKSKYKNVCTITELINARVSDLSDNTILYQLLPELSIGIWVAVKYKLTDKIKKFEAELIHIMSLLFEAKNYRWIAELSEILRYLGFHKKEKRISDESILKAMNYVEKCKNYYKDERNLNVHQYFCSEHIYWMKQNKMSNIDIKRIQIEIGEAFETQAEHQPGIDVHSYIVEAHYLNLALEHYIKVEVKDKIEEMKIKIKQAQKKIVDEVTIYETLTSIDNSQIEAVAEKFMRSSAEDSLRLLAASTYFIPDVKHLKIESIKLNKNPLLHLPVITKIDGNRLIFKAETINEQDNYYLSKHYDLYLKLSFCVLYERIWDKLKIKGLDNAMVANQITTWKYLTQDDKEIINLGIKRFFEEDYISALHILIPRFENCLRVYFEEGGYSTTVVKRSSIQHEQTFSEFLNNPFVIDNLDEDFLYLIKFVMLDSLGYNLRNNIAHGLAKMDIFNNENVQILLYLYFQLTNNGWDGDE